MKERILGQLVKIFLGMLDEKLLKKFADMVLDFIEEYTLATKSKLDDRILLPLCGLIRTTFDIKD